LVPELLEHEVLSGRTVRKLFQQVEAEAGLQVGS
jgi:hypothetical protein